MPNGEQLISMNPGVYVLVRFTGFVLIVAPAFPILSFSLVPAGAIRYQ